MTWYPRSEVPEPSACPACLDMRRVTNHGWADIACPRCGAMEQDAYETFLANHVKRTARQPDITQLDLTEEEFALYTLWRKTFPHTHSKTLLSWLEGQRYVPEEDAEFMRDCNAALERWRNDPRRLPSVEEAAMRAA